MAKVLVTEDYLSAIGDAIRGKLGGSTQYTPGQMASAIGSIPTVAPTLISKSIVANGTYDAEDDNADGYDSVSVNVPNSYSAQDEGKVVSSGALVAQESQSVSQNGTYNTTLKNQVVVSVPNTYEVSDNGKVVVNQALTAQTSKNISTNGTHDTTANNSVVVDVPNSYAAADEGKVVNNGGLVAQESQNITQNGVYDTTIKNMVVVNVPQGGGGDDVYALLTVLSSNSAVSVTKEGASLTPVKVEHDDLYNLYFIIPESGNWAVTSNGNSKTINVNNYFDKLYSSFVREDGIFIVSTVSGDSYVFSSRNGQRVLSTGLLIATAAKSNSAYISPAFYTLQDYGNVENVISSSYKQKYTFTLENPDDETETVTVYGYGSFNGGYRNVACVFSITGEDTFTIPVNNSFYAPYGNERNAYDSSPIESKRKFWNILKATIS